MESVNFIDAEERDSDLFDPEDSSDQKTYGRATRPLPARARSRTREGERGFALVIAMVALAALTVLGTAAITTSSLDLKVAHNMRRLDQARYASIAGTEHARRNMVLGVMPTEAQTVYFDEQGAATSYYIDSSQAVQMQSADGTPLGTYLVTSVAVKCGGPPAGYSVEQFYSQFFDLRSEGILMNKQNSEQLNASSTSVLTIRKVAEGRCFKR